MALRLRPFTVLPSSYPGSSVSEVFTLRLSITGAPRLSIVYQTHTQTGFIGAARANLHKIAAKRRLILLNISRKSIRLRQNR